MNMTISIEIKSFSKALEEAGARKVAFVYHLKIRDSNGYDEWLSESKNRFGCLERLIGEINENDYCNDFHIVTSSACWG